jgi:uncharacterized membrane protein HdeD (DUF308 family)
MENKNVKMANENIIERNDLKGGEIEVFRSRKRGLHLVVVFLGIFMVTAFFCAVIWDDMSPEMLILMFVFEIACEAVIEIIKSIAEKKKRNYGGQ